MNPSCKDIDQTVTRGNVDDSYTASCTDEYIQAAYDKDIPVMIVMIRKTECRKFISSVCQTGFTQVS